MNVDNQKRGGGSATQAGIIYQNRVAAWLCTRILAEKDAEPLWGWPAGSTMEFIRCETEQPIDDLMVGTSEYGLAFINVKRKVDLEKTPDSAFSSVIHQFVRQFVSGQTQSNGSRPWERALDPRRDRFVLITSSNSSSAIKENLRTALNLFRPPSFGGGLKEVAQDKQQALEVFRRHFERSWVETTGVNPSEQDFHDMLGLVWIEILDVEENGRDETWAKDRLRASVVEAQDRAGDAWRTLINTCGDFAKQSSGGNRETLQKTLHKEGINVKLPRGYQHDIELLRQNTEFTLSQLRQLSEIRVGQQKLVKIKRPICDALRQAVENHSIVVVGEPGAGKSGVLHDLVETLGNENRDVIFLAMDRLEARSLGELRLELGLEHDLRQVLHQWASDRSGFLIIDALDAARSETSAQTIFDLMSAAIEGKTRWRVVASIRQFDLRHNTKLQSLFSGQPPTEFRAKEEFFNLSHVSVPKLGVEEWKQIADQSQELAKLFVESTDKLRELLFVPFNVRLMGDLLGSGSSIESLTPIRTQIGLLDRYWEERVVRSDYQGDAREILLSRAVETMVQARALQATRRNVAVNPSDSQTLNDLLSSNILSETETRPEAPFRGSVLTFAHHVLFDYATARLLLRQHPNSLLDRLENDESLALAIRPSIVMHFEHEKLLDTDQFWQAVLGIVESERIPEIAKLIGPSVAVETMENLEDFAPLIRALSSVDLPKRTVAEKTLRHVTGALIVKATVFREPIVGKGALPWCELLDQCSAQLCPETVYSVRPVLHLICDQPDAMTEVQRALAGNVARRLLNFALTQERRNSTLVISGIETVCRTFESDPKVSAALLRRCLEPQHVLQHGHEELFRIANEVERLILLDPALVEDIYRAAFICNDESDEKTQMGTLVLRLTSTRKQDFNHARWVLGGKYKLFLEKAPLNALRVMIDLAGLWVTQNYLSRTESIEEKFFDFNGRTAFIKGDFSYIWDESSLHDDKMPLSTLRSFQHFMEVLSKDNEHISLRHSVIDLIVRHNHLAVIWRRLLETATKFPETLGQEIRCLAWALPILTSQDTTQRLGEFLKAAFKTFDPIERELIERAILSIPDSVEAEEKAGALHDRNRLLGCLEISVLVTPEAKAIRATEESPANEPTYKIGQHVSWVPTDEGLLAHRGVNVAEEQNRRVIELYKNVERLSSFNNSAPTLAQVRETYPALRALHEALVATDIDRVDESVCVLAWGYLASACESAARCDDLTCEDDIGHFIKAILLEAADYPHPQYHPESAASFDKHPSWGSPAARIEAASGLMALAHCSPCVDTQLLDKVEKLATDSVPAVRYQVAVRLRLLYKTAPDLMWKLLERFSLKDESRGVLQGLLVYALHDLSGAREEGVAELVRAIFERIREGDGADEVQKNCTTTLLRLHLWRRHPLCSEIIQRIANDPASYDTEAHQILFNLRELLNLGPIKSVNIEQEAARLESFRLTEQILKSTQQSIRSLEGANTGKLFPDWSQLDQEKWRKLAQLAEAACREIYFASGAYRDGADGNGIPRGKQERTRFLQESISILELLAQFPYPSLTHHLLETLEYLLAFDPTQKNVFLLIGEVVRRGQEGYYQFDPMAVELVVRLIERFIAEFRHVLQQDDECRRVLIEILNIFVDAGWASARRLTYRLEEIFR